MTRLLLVLETLFVALVVAGVAAIYWPAGLIVAGVLGVLAMERAQAERRGRSGGVGQ